MPVAVTPLRSSLPLFASANTSTITGTPARLRPTAWAGLLLVGCLLLGGCSTAPLSPPQPAAAAPAAFKESALWDASAASAAAPADVPEAWWTLFNDPELDRLQARLVIGNQNLQAAAAQVASARAVLGASRAAQSPSVSLGGNAGRSNSGNDSSNAAAQNNLSVSANAAWELDLWGRLAQATRGNEARYQASLADLAGVRLSAQATLAQTWFALRAAEAQQLLIERSLVGYRRTLELTQARRDVGVAPPTDVLQAQTQLKSAQVQGLEAANQRALAEHAIAVLLGQPPSALSIAPTVAAVAAVAAAETSPPLDASTLLPLPPQVPRLLPSTLLQRRPDIGAAEQRVAAAYAQIGVADAGFFPSLTLSAGGGLRGGSVAELLNAPSLFWSLGAALTQKLFDGGAQQAVSDQARASADQAGALYRQTVLQALQEVEDNLLLAERLQRETELQQDALGYAQRNLDITQDQYRAGTVSYLNVVTAQTTVLNAERSLLDLRTRQLNAVNQLLKNIAGRW